MEFHKRFWGQKQLSINNMPQFLNQEPGSWFQNDKVKIWGGMFHELDINLILSNLILSQISKQNEYDCFSIFPIKIAVWLTAGIGSFHLPTIIGTSNPIAKQSSRKMKNHLTAPNLQRHSSVPSAVIKWTTRVIKCKAMICDFLQLPHWCCWSRDHKKLQPLYMHIYCQVPKSRWQAYRDAGMGATWWAGHKSHYLAPS